MTQLLFAHQSGWDELLMFLVPAAFAIFGLRWAERCARARARDEDADDPTAGDA
ncbi:MAG: hypothetical protein OEM97_00175 [Acidimicrobiia bacterium]|nr:hypothetical protein [Acidimicrobiia bacterium]